MSYDAAGNISAIVDRQESGLTSRSMGYDLLDRLTQANGIWGAGTYTYDGLDNVRSSVVGGRSLTHHIDGMNRLSALSGSQSVGISYDANGNVSQRGGQVFTFDIGNRLSSAQAKATYSYDGAGRRSRSDFVDGTSALYAYTRDGKLRGSYRNGQGSTRHVYLGDKLIADAQEGTPVSFVHTDPLGSPIARTDSSGQVTSRTRYEPYGGTAAGTNPTKIGFTGHVNDVDTGLVYMQQRYYDPVAGRFLSVDPVTTNATDGSYFNRYVYAANNPYKYKDPDGRAFETAWDIASLALSVGQFMQSPSLGNALGVAVDAAAVAIPGIPGGVGALRAMGNAAEAGGRASKTEIHHVVPQTDKRAAEARDVMKSQGINPKTESTNKVALPGDKHDITKRDSYVRDTNQRVAAQPTADAVKAECCKIADNLQKSTVNELNKQYPAK